MATSLYRLVVSAAREHLCSCEKVILTLPWEPHRGRFCLRGSAEVTDSNLDYFTAWITSLHPFCPAGSHPHWSPSLYKVDVVSPFRTRNRNFSTGKRQSLTSNFPSDWLIGFILLADRLQNEAIAVLFWHSYRKQENGDWHRYWPRLNWYPVRGSQAH